MVCKRLACWLAATLLAFVPMYASAQTTTGEIPAIPQSVGSAYVPLDHWAYPLFDYLAASGYAPAAFVNLRPWTRVECARLVYEAGTILESDPNPNPEALAMHRELAAEFANELELFGGPNRRMRLESVYTRFMGISGRPLTDGFHFGQTVVNDFGRPYEEGFNVATGLSAWAVGGPFVAYFRGEYQHAPGAPPLSQDLRQLISSVDQVPILPAQETPTRNQFRLLDTYVGVNLRIVQITFGKQSLSWDPGVSGSLNLSENAAPIYMLRIAQATPRVLPSFFKILGPIRTEMFFGKLSGHRVPVRPWIFGQKITVKPTPNLEFGLSRTAMFAGGGPSPGADVPLTPRTFRDVVFSFAGGATSDRRIGFDVRYRLPKLRRNVTVYLDTMADDDETVLVDPQNGVYKPGIHLVNLPSLRKFEFRLERPLASTQFTTGSSGIPRPNNGRLAYWNNLYRNGYTHDGNLLGTWIGRSGQGWWAEAKYWISPRDTVRFQYRHAGVHGQFIPQGGTLSQASGQGNFLLGSTMEVVGRLQFERWNFPVLNPRSQSNVTATFQITYWPRREKGK